MHTLDLISKPLPLVVITPGECVVSPTPALLVPELPFVDPSILIASNAVPASCYLSLYLQLNVISQQVVGNTKHQSEVLRCLLGSKQPPLCIAQFVNVTIVWIDEALTRALCHPPSRPRIAPLWPGLPSPCHVSCPAARTLCSSPHSSMCARPFHASCSPGSIPACCMAHLLEA